MVSRQLPSGGTDTGAGGFLGDLYSLLAQGLEESSAVLGGTGGMGGRFTAFTAAYDPVAEELSRAGCDLAGAVSQLLLMVATTFENYHRAEDAAVDTLGGHMGRPPQPASAAYPLIAPPPTAVGDNGGEPWVWHVFVAVHGGVQWPDVATGTVRRAAGAWSALGSAFGEAGSYLDCALADLDQYRAPELPLAAAVVERLGRAMSAYADQCAGLATALSGFADTADAALAELRHKCSQAELEAGAGSVLAGAAAVVTFWAGGAGGGVSEAALNAVLAGTIGTTIADLATGFLETVATLAESLQVMEPIIQTSALTAGGILEARTIQVSFDRLDTPLTADAEVDGVAEAGSDYSLTIEELRRLEQTSNTHVIARHVGRTRSQLAERFTGKNKVPFSSTFPDAETAVACINRVLTTDRDEIDAWLTSGRRAIRLNGQAVDPVGIVMEPSGTVYPSKQFRVFLVRDNSLPSGFRVDSAYPIQREDQS